MRHWLPTALIGALMLLMVWRRFRFLRMRHRYRPLRMLLRVGILGALGGSLLFLPWISLPLSIAAVALGGGLAAYAVSATEFERGERGLTYRSTSRVGTVIFALFAARVAWRLIERLATGQPLGPRRFAADGVPPDHMPLTLLLMFLLIGYAVGYTTGVLLRARTALGEPATESSPR